MHIHTNPRQLVSSIRYITQMSTKCEYLWTQWVVTLSIQTMITMEPNVSNHFWMDANCRSGSVCLDVINQTWSPMFGNNWSFRFITCVDIQLVNIPCCVIITTGTPGALYFKSISDILQILSMCLRSSSHNFYYIRILLIHWMEMLLHWWCVIGLLMNKKWKVTRLSIVCLLVPILQPSCRLH